MAAKFGSLRHSFIEKSKERLLSRKGYSELGFAGSENEVDGNEGVNCCCLGSKRRCYRRIVDWFSGFANAFKDTAVKFYEMGRSDPRKVIFALKMGSALALVSLLQYLKEPFQDISQYSLWGCITVVVCFEYSVGACLLKGFNRALGTITSGSLAFGLSEIAIHVGAFRQPLIVFGMFLAGSCASYVKLYPAMKPYEYGHRVFLMTWSIVMVTGNKASKFFRTAFFRLLLVAMGATTASIVNTCVLPIWAGEDLHKGIVKNFKGVAASLEGCVNGYLQCVAYDKIPSTILTYRAYDDPLYGGYRTCVQSSSNEESLMELAKWEPPHGPYRSFNYPWENYVKVGGALRHCAFMVMAMHGCILSEIQAPAEKRQVFADELRRVSNAGAKLLRELGTKVEKMEKLDPGDILEEVHMAAEELQMKIDRKSYLLVFFEHWEESKRPKEFEDPERVAQMKDCRGSSHQLVFDSLSEAVLNIDTDQMQSDLGIPSSRTSMFGVGPSMQGMFSTESIGSRTQWPSRLSLLPDLTINEKEARTYESASSLSLATFASLLVEFVARLGYLVDAFEELSEKACFKEPTMEPQVEKETTGFWNKWIRCFQFRN